MPCRFFAYAESARFCCSTSSVPEVVSGTLVPFPPVHHGHSGRSELNNLFSGLPESLPEELTEVLAEDRRIRIERIISTGQASPPGFWYDQDEEEWVSLLKGAARLLFADNDQSVDLQAGDHLLIPAHRKHRIEWTSSTETTLWLAVFWKS